LLTLVGSACAKPVENRHAASHQPAYRLLIIDEIGYLPMNREQANLFFQVVADALRERQH
jgi:DNA replication protein DnaC